ncbi:MAG: ATP-binding cassette domain-containing protein [Hydrogenophilaceae bacterium]|jgi:ABC-type multidrug transport system ATPase subunit|nr:ATP-binding cassette domain-containing protein [Hydrogenophilaceae bacterium]
MSSQAAEPWLSLANVVRRYGKRDVVAVNDLALGPGDAVEIIGANGSGKSTLLRLLAGYGRPSSGKIDFARALKRGRIGYLPQSGGLYPNLTVLQNIEVIARLLGRTVGFDDRSVRPVYELGVAPFMNTTASNLSGGYQRLAAIAAVVAAEPDAIMLDEPLSSLDLTAQQRVLSLISSRAQPNRLIAFTAHTPSGASWLTATIEVVAGQGVTVSRRAAAQGAP